MAVKLQKGPKAMHLWWIKERRGEKDGLGCVRPCPMVWSQGGRDCPGDRAFPGSEPHHVQSSSASPGSQEGPFISTLSSPLWSQEMIVFTQNCQNEKNNQNLANHLFFCQLRKSRKVLFRFFSCSLAIRQEIFSGLHVPGPRHKVRKTYDQSRQHIKKQRR